VDVSIIFVNWNSADYLRECLPSIRQWTSGLSLEVIVVDNASPTGDVDSLKAQFPEIKLIKSGTNLGFAGANNLGFRQASGDFVLFLNPDTKLVSPAINVMLQHLQTLPAAGVVGCKLLNADLSVQTSSIMNFPTILNSMFRVEYLRLRWPKLWGIGPLFSAYPGPVVVEAISGACMLVRREVFEKVGMFSQEYFMYSEDLDLCHKMKRSGFTNYYVGQATIVHYGGKSSAPEWQTVMKTKAELLFCEKNYGHLYSLVFRVVQAGNAMLRIALITGVRLVRKLAREKSDLEQSAARWRAILRTVLTRCNAATAPLAKATSASDL
jgi:N-acetylglucosaminyl-diphospho-decaprenol L-rhamnosyltransferase